MTNKILEINNLKKYFPITSGFIKKTSGYIKAVDGVSFSLKEGEALGLVGESGSGKSTIGRSILRLIEPTEGEIIYNGENIMEYKRKELKSIRNDLQMIFQDPYASLNPRMRIGQCIIEPMLHHHICESKEAEARALKLLHEVGLQQEHFRRYPHQFSGGQRQRVGIARALALNPKIIIADEPVSALDVSVQAQTLNLFMELKNKFKLTYLFITHDLGVVKHICDRIAVMYLGKIVELAETEKLFSEPLHPYTEALLSAVPTTKKEKNKKIVLQGDIPSPSNVPIGCNFSTRCNKSMDICKKVKPQTKNINGHMISCHLYQ